MLVTLQSADIVSLIKSLSASNLYHNNLDESEFSYPNEKQEIIAKHKLLQDHLKTYLDQSVPSCPCPPEFPSIESSDVAYQVGKDRGILSRSYPKKKNITYLNALKDIKAQIAFLNKCSFDKSILTSDEHYALLGIEEELQKLIHFDPIRPDEGLPLRYDHFVVINGSQLPDNLE